MNRRFHNVAAKIVATAVCASSLTLSVQAVAQPTNPSDNAISEADQEVHQSNEDVSRLVTSLTEKEQEVLHLEHEMGGLREAVNKTIVDLHDAQAAAEQARQEARTAKDTLDSTQTELEKAQHELDELSRAAYRRGATNAGITAAAGNTVGDAALDRQTFLRMRAEKQQQTITDLERLRTKAANEESLIRQAQKLAEEREAQATEARNQAEANIERTRNLLQAKQEERAGLIAQRAAAEERLAAARNNVDSLGRQRAEYQEYLQKEDDRKAAEEHAEQAQQQADEKAQEQQRLEAAAEQAQVEVETAPVEDQQTARERAEQAAAEAEAAKQQAEQEAKNAADAKALQEAALALAVVAAEALIQASTPNHQDLNDPYTPTTEQQTDETGTLSDALSFASETEGSYSSVTDSASEMVTGSRAEKIEIVINRAMSQLGVSYAWGGGDASGPTQGIRDGGVADSHGDYNKIGFDCSGLVLYAFAGVGISLPHYTGYQYNHGVKIDPSQMERGDLIFYGPNAEHHVAIYLGDGTMIEAPQSGSSVQISPVRWSGMTSHAVRLIS